MAALRLISAEDNVSFDVQTVRDRERPPIITVPASRWERTAAATGAPGAE